jgi:hypothetical protein
MFNIITKNVCVNYNLNGVEDLFGDLSPRGTGMEKKYSPQAFVSIPWGNFFRRRDGDGKLFFDGEFFVAIPRRQR